MLLRRKDVVLAGYEFSDSMSELELAYVEPEQMLGTLLIMEGGLSKGKWIQNKLEDTDGNFCLQAWTRVAAARLLGELEPHVYPSSSTFPLSTATETFLVSLLPHLILFEGLLRKPRPAPWSRGSIVGFNDNKQTKRRHALGLVREGRKVLQGELILQASSLPPRAPVPELVVSTSTPPAEREKVLV